MMNKFGAELREYLDFYNISINEFASRMDITPKNLIDILNGKIELTFNMIFKISIASGIDRIYIENVEEGFKLQKTIDNYLSKNNMTIKEFINKFSYKEATKEYGLRLTNEKNLYLVAEDILKYLKINNPETLTKNDNSIFYKSKNDKPELLALWQEACYRIIQQQKIGEYKKDNLEIILSYIKNSARDNKFDESELIQVFNKNGIYLAIVNDLKGSKIRGSFRVLGNKPAIYITKKHKRIADIYFALLHELAHCKSDFNRAKKGMLVSDYNVKSHEEYELKADKTAFNWMVDDKYYEKNKFVYDIEDNSIIPSFYVYRLAYDGIISYGSDLYQKYNKIIEDKV